MADKILLKKSFVQRSVCFCVYLCFSLHIMWKSHSDFFISESQTDTRAALCLFPYSRVRLAHHICAVGRREVYLIFMAARPLRAGVTTEQWSMQGLRLAKTLTLFQNIRENNCTILQGRSSMMFKWQYKPVKIAALQIVSGVSCFITSDRCK